MPTATGYSGTPLAAKLGFKPGMHVAMLIQAPKYHALLEPATLRSKNQPANDTQRALKQAA